ncbi:Formylglycine-generating enzyme, required for sulfatase activity, contains SUMF1/FGE domain [Gemmobacter aquatilis]|uniref:Formylglycine-generating enzyme, required for sulfatase activity, contains SUMF1/FGE domain n=1 Tax=Gemmobacter aquatilis TaxID=933059 RepID=A0A1H8EDW2_9RHOB|nr:formylglycine-generating enzyme family protein [Gemmobacter aquatilis]SEN17017.1 Formylglycine-generating enzyme, required for sulfatase activity, contains SUMF1/FGE domain [Gemmobacter aquatilis]
MQPGIGLGSSPARRTVAPTGMIHLSGGLFRMGSDRHYPEEAPARMVRVDAFTIDVTPVTNAQFAQFVTATGHVTQAEIAPRAEDYPGALPEYLKPGSAVFEAPRAPVPLGTPLPWWRYVVGANWRHPYGPGSSIDGLGDHPVVQVAYADALAYATWAGKALPTEAEWEFAARGGLDGADFAWGEDLTPNGRHMANTWQGRFPTENLAEDGYVHTSPVGAFPPNGYGLYDMIGNVWEWTEDWYAERLDMRAAKSCCAPPDARSPDREASIDPGDPARVPRKVLKGGSHLCAPSYCQRYRPAARQPEAIDTATTHIGFRCVLRG